MKITIRALNLKISEAIKKYIEKKAQLFDRPIARYLANKEEIKKNPIEGRKERVESFWEVGLKSLGKKRELFSCEIQVLLPGKAKQLIARAESNDLHEAIDRAKDIITDQIIETKEKGSTKNKKNSQKIKNNLETTSEEE